MNISSDPTGIESANVRLKVQCFNKLRHRVSLIAYNVLSQFFSSFIFFPSFEVKNI